MYTSDQIFFSDAENVLKFFCFYRCFTRSSSTTQTICNCHWLERIDTTSKSKLNTTLTTMRRSLLSTLLEVKVSQILASYGIRMRKTKAMLNLTKWKLARTIFFCKIILRNLNLLTYEKEASKWLTHFSLKQYS